MERLRVTWSGNNVVGPGLSTFYGDEGEGGLDPDAILDFFDTIKGSLLAGTTITIPDGGDLMNEATGEIGGYWSNPGTGGVVVGGTPGAYAAGVGARAVWRTGGVVSGRRVVGSTYLCPLTFNAYAGDGTLDPGTVSTLSGAAAQLAADAGPGMVIWSRPAPGRAGTMHAVTDGSVPDKVSWLRSRRT